MACARPAAVALSAALLLGGCAASRPAGQDGPDLSFYDLQARIAARAASLVGQAGEFRVGSERFNADCTGFIEAVYEAEGIPLRALMRAAAPEERSGVAAAFRTMRAHGTVFGRRGDWPAPGDLVFWHDTYDRNRNGKADDPFTHVGIVEYVVDGTVVFLHRGGQARVPSVAQTIAPVGEPDGDDAAAVVGAADAATAGGDSPLRCSENHVPPAIRAASTAAVRMRLRRPRSSSIRLSSPLREMGAPSGREVGLRRA